MGLTIGIIIGTVSLLILVAGACFFFWRRRRDWGNKTYDEVVDEAEAEAERSLVLDTIKAENGGGTDEHDDDEFLRDKAAEEKAVFDAISGGGVQPTPLARAAPDISKAALGTPRTDDDATVVPLETVDLDHGKPKTQQKKKQKKKKAPSDDDDDERDNL